MARVAEGSAAEDWEDKGLEGLAKVVAELQTQLPGWERVLTDSRGSNYHSNSLRSNSSKW